MAFHIGNTHAVPVDEHFAHILLLEACLVLVEPALLTLMMWPGTDRELMASIPVCKASLLSRAITFQCEQIKLEDQILETEPLTPVVEETQSMLRETSWMVAYDALLCITVRSFIKLCM